MQIFAGVGAAARVSVAGYFGGGIDSVDVVSGIDKIAFPADSKIYAVCYFNNG
jgi:hypothetical protein